MTLENDETVESGDPRDAISQLEAHIEELAKTIERCRKIIVAAKIAIVVGAVVILALMLGTVRFNPAAMVAAMAAVIGGVVVLGSNASTAQQATAELKTAEARRAELIGGIELRVIASPGL